MEVVSIVHGSIDSEHFDLLKCRNREVEEFKNSFARKTPVINRSETPPKPKAPVRKKQTEIVNAQENETVASVKGNSCRGACWFGLIALVAVGVLALGIALLRLLF